MDGSGAAPELERARGLRGRGTVCSTVSTGLPPTLPPHALYLCRSRGAVYQKRVLTITGICVALLVVGIVCVVAYCKTK